VSGFFIGSALDAVSDFFFHAHRPSIDARPDVSVSGLFSWEGETRLDWVFTDSSCAGAAPSFFAMAAAATSLAF
jgi:hypothetical protein